MTDANLIEIFCIIDEFCKYFAPELKKHMVDNSGKRRRNRPCLMSDSEVMTILVLFHTMRHRDIKFVLSRLYLQPHAQGVSPPPVIQPLCGEAGKGWASPAAVSPDMRIGQMYRHIDHRFHATCVMSHEDG